MSVELRTNATSLLFAMSYGGVRCTSCGCNNFPPPVKNSSEFRCLHKGYSPNIHGTSTIIYVCSKCKDILVSMHQFTPLSK